MMRTCLIATLALVVAAAPAQTAEIKGNYLEVRNCDIWTGPCFANAEGNLTGKNAAMVWRISEGALGGVRLDGLSVIAVIQATDTLGARQGGESKAVLIVDSRATEAQRQALVKLVHLQGGELVKNVAAVETAAIKVDFCCCEGNACAEIDAGILKIKTRCLDHHDTVCGNESAYYPPLIEGVKCIPGVAEHGYTGKNLPTTWFESGRRGAYVGTFNTAPSTDNVFLTRK